MIFARDVAGESPVPGTSDERIGLAGRAAHEDRVSTGRFRDLIQQRIEDPGCRGSAELQLMSFPAGLVPLVRMSTFQLRSRNSAGDVVVIFLRSIAVELPIEAPETKGPERGRFLLDGKR